MLARTLKQQNITYEPDHSVSSGTSPTTTYLSTLLKTFDSYGLRLQRNGYSPQNGNYLISQLPITSASIDFANRNGYYRITDLIAQLDGQPQFKLPDRLLFLRRKLGLAGHI